ncbi:MAG: TolB family protein [Blastocatellales bacterium]
MNEGKDNVQPAISDEQVELSRKRVLSTMAFMAICLIIVIGAMYVAYRRTRNHAKTAFQKISIASLQAPGNTLHPVIYKDGSFVAFVNEENEQQSLWVKKVFEPIATQIVPPASVSYVGVTFSIDGKFVFYVAKSKGERENKLYRIPSAGGKPEELLTGVDSPISFSPNGQYFAFVRNHPVQSETSLIIKKLDGAEEMKLIARKQPEALSLLGPAWSPDGRIIACAVVTSDSEATMMRVLAVNPDDSSAQPIGDQKWADVKQLAWLDDGSGLIVSARQPNQDVADDVHQLYLLAYPKGEIRRVTNDRFNYECVSVTADSGVLASLKSEPGKSIKEVVLINSVNAE